jgi:hypothetical protein
VLNKGITDAVWSDHTDIRPTMMALLGLHDDYRSDGRVLTRFLTGTATPPALRNAPLIEALGAAYKQLNASVGSFGLDTLAASTTALASGSSTDDSTYAALSTALTGLGQQRDAVAQRIADLLSAAAFDNQPIGLAEAVSLLARAKALLLAAHALAG